MADAIWNPATPVEPKALASSIAVLEAWEARADGEPLTQDEGESLCLALHELKRLAATPSPPVAAPPATPAPVEWVPDMAHVANEWADMASNGLQWLRNVRDGISTAEDAIANMESNLQHCYDTSAREKAAQPQPQPAQPLTGASPLSDEQIAIRAACSQIIKSLADIVTAPIADDQPFAETVHREPLMQRVQEIKAQVHAIHKALPHPMMQAAPSTPTPEVAP